MKIIGTSGVSILLAGQVMMRHDPVICIKEPELVNKHTAVLRFKSEKISEFLNIPFDKVTIDKAIKYEGSMFCKSDLRLQNMYSYKVTGNILDRSIRNLESEIRYIAPDNFFDLLKIGLNIKTGCDLMAELFDNTDEVKLSYVKMPDVMDKLKVEKPNFSFNPVYTINARILSPEVNVYQTIYYPGKEPHYRCSITKDNLIIECIREPELDVEGGLEYYVQTILSEDFGNNIKSTLWKAKNLPIPNPFNMNDPYSNAIELSKRDNKKPYNPYTYNKTNFHDVSPEYGTKEFDNMYNADDGWVMNTIQRDISNMKKYLNGEKGFNELPLSHIGDDEHGSMALAKKYGLTKYYEYLQDLYNQVVQKYKSEQY